MWQIVSWQQFLGFRNKSQEEKISGTIWKKEKEGSEVVSGVKTSAAILSLLAYCNSSVDPDTNKYQTNKLDARKNHLNSTKRTKKHVFSCLETQQTFVHW